MAIWVEPLPVPKAYQVEPTLMMEGSGKLLSPDPPSALSTTWPSTSLRLEGADISDKATGFAYTGRKGANNKAFIAELKRDMLMVFWKISGLAIQCAF